LEELFAQGLASSDAATRKKAYDAIQQYQYDNVLFIPLYARANVYAYQDTLVDPGSSGYAGGGFGAWAAEYYDTTK
jgi:ABC-type transport system substrate-binding protein